jgi:siroheme synthase
MGAGQAEAVSAALIARGRAADTPVALVESASLSRSRVTFGTLATLPRLAAGADGEPGVILLGEVLRDRLEAQREAVQRTAANTAAA